MIKCRFATGFVISIELSYMEYTLKRKLNQELSSDKLKRKCELVLQKIQAYPIEVTFDFYFFGLNSVSRIPTPLIFTRN